MTGVARALIAVIAVVVIAAGAILVLPMLQGGNGGGQPSSAPATPTPSIPPSPSPSVEPSPTPSVEPSPTVEPSPSPTPAPSVAAAPAACQAGDLAVRLTDWQGAAGSRFGTLRIRNSGASDCLVSGTPGLQLVDAHGQVFLDSANLGNPASASPAEPVITLGAGASTSVYLVIGLANYCAADPVAPVRLALVLPASLGRVVATAPAGVRVDMAPCNGATVPTELHVQEPWSVTAP